MAGIGLLLNIAKDALLTQQYAIDLTSHNISNVSTEGYSRQTPVIGAKEAAPYGGFLFGRGVEISEILRNTNIFIEKRFLSGQSDLSAMSEKEQYMGILETLFNEDSAGSLNSRITDFWNAWNDLSNNPSGLSERSILTEYGTLLTEGFNNLKGDLDELAQEIDNSIDGCVNEVNRLLAGIADLNRQILVIETSGNANDLRDQRSLMVSRLSEYLDLKTYEYDDGSVTITTGKGYNLVSRNDTYSLRFDGNDLIWEGSSTSWVAITDMISGGRIGGLLDMKVESIPEYSYNLDELAKATIWEINKIHSQGVGLKGFTDLAGDYSVTDGNKAMGDVDSGLDFHDKITDGSFKIWLYDASGTALGEATIPVDSDADTLYDLAATIDGISIAGEDALTATVRDGKLCIEIDSTSCPDYTFAFSDDTSNILAALGINTFFSSSNSGNIAVTDNILSDTNNISASRINNNVGPAAGAIDNTSTGILTTSGPYTGDEDATYEIRIVNGTQFQWSKDGSAWSTDTDMTGSPVLGGDGVKITFNGSFDVDDTFTIDVTENSDTYGDFTPGDNRNALA
ncbi:flagellar hook-associated protein FlgK, partial [Deltaproteobacteria bacterium]|nr:flagellar hook-associated protein FlgK [Deltaproteobacteria bacterium]